jgi:alkaline phosphatase
MTLARLVLIAVSLTLTLPAAAGPEEYEDPWFEAGSAAVKRARTLMPGAGKARSVILFVGDGMGIATVTAARILEGQLRGETGEENLLEFEKLPFVALAKTYNTDQQVPDSAGTMTAMVTGVKTKAGVLSLDERVVRRDAASATATRVDTILERAERRGLSTGVISTTKVTHATPAACYAHSPHRGWEDDSDLPEAARELGFPDIARQLIEFPLGDGVEVALGGGRAHFLPASRPDPEHPGKTGSREDGRDLMEEWRGRFEGGAAIWNGQQLAALDPAQTTHLLGLFEPSYMNWEADRAGDAAGEPSLSEMTEKAIQILSKNPRGFFLMVEGGRIDHGHHANNAYRALTDTIELSNAVRRARELTDSAETLIVVTADHSHVMTIAGYPTRGNPILGLVVENDRRGLPEKKPARDATGRPYTTLTYANGPGYLGASDVQPQGSKQFPHRAKEFEASRSARPDLTEVDTTAPGYLQESAVPFDGETHGGEDVPVYAGGPGAALFHGVQEQSYLYHAMVAALGWPDRD